ncbi:VOC family protein, partial [Streptomyces nigra]
MAGTGGGRPGISPTLLYTDAKAAVEQLTNAFGFTALAVYEGDDGKVVHAELAQGDGVVMPAGRGLGHLRQLALGDDHGAVV